MHKEVLDPKTEKILDTLGSVEQLRQFYLAGGTGIALHLGHRRSIDLDFFTPQEFDGEALKTALSKVGRLRILYENHHTLEVSLNDVKISLFFYPYRLIFPTSNFGNINVADLRDIAPMKLTAISQRGSKKDFVDLYFLLKNYSLPELLDFFERRFRGVEYSTMHLLKSLSYFDDAEDEPMPSMIRGMDWGEIKEAILAESKKIVS